jgi:tRNA-2-methylthio-N6-dimethylallyladenosine synthase
MRTFYLETFGCQMNEHDSEKVAGLLMAQGLERVEDPWQADLVLYNTCSIREKAERKVFSRLSEFRRPRGEGKLLGVLGCVAQREGLRIFERAPQVRLVCGSASYPKLPELLARAEAGERRLTGLDLAVESTFETPLVCRDSPYRAYVTIVEGCDKACAYCVVPSARGGERSRSSASVMAEIRQLAQQGYTEVQLLGQNVNCYRDPSPAGWDFVTLVARVAQVSGLRRVRFITSHPRDFGREIVAAIDTHPVLAEHVHLPVQSGSSRVLAGMQRLYNREEYLQRIEWIRSARRQIAISTDVIVGFPGETEADFQQTLSLLEEVRFDSAFSFKYSRRPLTAAASLDAQIPEEEKGRRLAALLERQRAIQLRRNGELVGTVQEVLVEDYHPATGQWVGRTSQNRVLNFASAAGDSRSLLGRYVQARVTRAGPNSLVGESLPDLV